MSGGCTISLSSNTITMNIDCLQNHVEDDIENAAEELVSTLEVGVLSSNSVVLDASGLWNSFAV